MRTVHTVSKLTYSRKDIPRLPCPRRSTSQPHSNVPFPAISLTEKLGSLILTTAWDREQQWRWAMVTLEYALNWLTVVHKIEGSCVHGHFDADIVQDTVQTFRYRSYLRSLLCCKDPHSRLLKTAQHAGISIQGQQRFSRSKFQEFINYSANKCQRHFADARPHCVMSSLTQSVSQNCFKRRPTSWVVVQIFFTTAQGWVYAHIFISLSHFTKKSVHCTRKVSSRNYRNPTNKFSPPDVIPWNTTWGCIELVALPHGYTYRI